MISKNHRALTEDEASRLRKRKRRLARRLWSEPVLGPLLLLFGTIVGLASLPPAGERALGPVLFLVGWVALGIFILRGLWKERDSLRLELALLEQSLAEDRVEVVRCQAAAAITVLFEERWQVDMGWLLEVGSDELLYVVGIAALPTHPGNDAPSTRFEIRWCPGTGICLDTEASSVEVPSHRLLDSGELAPEVLRQLPVLADGADVAMTLLPGRLPVL